MVCLEQGHRILCLRFRHDTHSRFSSPARTRARGTSSGVRRISRKLRWSVRRWT
jgi:hypothetical protein